MAYQHREDGSVILDRGAAEELAELLLEARNCLLWHDRPTEDYLTRLELAAAALMPFPPAGEGS